MAGFSTKLGVASVAQAADVVGFDEYADGLRRKRIRLGDKVKSNVERFTSKSIPSALTVALGVGTGNPLLLASGTVGLANAVAQTELENMRDRNELTRPQFERAMRVSAGVSLAATVASGVGAAAGIGSTAQTVATVGASGTASSASISSSLSGGGATTLAFGAEGVAGGLDTIDDLRTLIHPGGH